MNRIVPTLLVILSLLSPMVWAVTVKNLYTVVVPVSDFSDAERNRAVRAGLEKVLVRLTGSSGISSNPSVRKLLTNANSYALEFGYVNLQTEPGKQGLTMTFTAKEIDEFLRHQQLPVWPLNRTPILVWVLSEPSGMPKAFATPEENQDLYKRLGKLFEDRAMPVQYPLYDLEDQLALSVEDGWGFNADRVATASHRYGADNWLVVRCYETSGTNWRVSWLLGEKSGPSLDDIEADSLDEALAKAVDRTVDRVAAQYTYIPTANAQNIVMDISGVRGYESYRKMTDLISGLSMVQSLTLQTVSRDRISLVLKVEGDKQVLLEALAPYDQLSSLDQNPAALPDHLTFVWNPEPGR